MMKNLCWIISLLLLLGCKSDSENDVSKRNADWIWWVDEHTGKGEWIKSGDHTTVKDGKYTMFYYNGNVFEKGTLENGERVDTCYYFDTLGKCYGFKPIIENEIKYYYYKNGPLKIYFNTGELNGEGIIANNRREKWTGYLRDGQISFQHDYTNGVGWCTENYDNGKPKRIYYSTGYDDSVLSTKMWNENGILVFDAEIENGDYNGTVKKYFDKGVLSQTIDYKKGQIDGYFTSYYPSGRIEYRNIYVSGIPNGKSLSYYENGQPKAFGFFKDGKLNGSCGRFYENGKPKLVCNYFNGNYEGTIIEYDSLGQIISKREYHNGILIK